MTTFQVLYTKHKTQTRKTWQDGFIKFNSFNRKVVLTSENENEVLDSLFLKQAFHLRDGSIFETEKFLVDIQEIDGFTAALNGAPAPKPPPKAPPPTAPQRPHTAGDLKRKAEGALSATEPKKRRLGLNRAVMRAGLISNVTEFKQPSTKVMESSDSLDTVSVQESLSAPSTQELHPVPGEVDTPELAYNRNADNVVKSQYIAEKLEVEQERVAESVTSTTARVSEVYVDHTSFDFGPSSPEIDFGYLIEPLEPVTQASEERVYKLNESDVAQLNWNQIQSTAHNTPPLEGSTTERYEETTDMDDRYEHTARMSAFKNTRQPLAPTLHRRVGLGRSSASIDASPRLAVDRSAEQLAPINDKPQSEFKSPKQTLLFAKANRWTHSSLCFPDKATCEDLEKSMPKPKRSVTIPNTFADIQQYTDTFTEALNEELNLQLLELAQRFHKLAGPLLSGKAFVSHETEKQFRSKGIKLYASCELSKSTINPFAKYQKDARDKAQLYLTIDKTSREHYSNYAKDDVWIFSSSPHFTPRNADDVFFLARSVYHGPTANGLIEIRPVHDMPRLGNKQVVHALHGPNASLDFSMLENLIALRESKLPLIPSLLGQFAPPPNLRINLPQSRILELARHTIAEHRLNEDQQRVIMSCVRWFSADTIQLKDDIVLVHGVYGSGKSHLLVVLIIFLCTLLKEAQNDDIRILVSAATNTAVDRILLGLLDLDFTEFIRVGSLKRIAKPVLPFTLHRDRGDSKSDNDRSDKLALKELQEMMTSTVLSNKEKSYIKQAIEDLKSGRAKQRIEKLKKVRVVGVTCAASVFPVLEGNKFPLVILDESSQMLEPLSLLPIGKFGCEKLISVGDPMQLPPTLTSNQITTTQDEPTLGKTLFTRLANLGVKPIMLRTQYRLHPQLSKISNKLFYDNQLRDGVTLQDREPLAADIPTLLFCNTANAGNEVMGFGGSYYNQHEAAIVVELILMLLDRGCRGADIGVIALYKQQEQKIGELLLQRSGVPVTGVNQSPALDTDDEACSRESALRQVQISTVDAFQGAEKEVIIVSTVRTTKRGFTDSPNRLNVALTRARRHLLIVGRASILTGSHLWREVIVQARAAHRGFQHAHALMSSKSFAVVADELLSDALESETDTRHGDTELGDQPADCDLPGPELTDPPCDSEPSPRDSPRDSELDEGLIVFSEDSALDSPGPCTDTHPVTASTTDTHPVTASTTDTHPVTASTTDALASLPGPGQDHIQNSSFEDFDVPDEFDLGF